MTITLCTLPLVIAPVLSPCVTNGLQAAGPISQRENVVILESADLLPFDWATLGATLDH